MRFFYYLLLLTLIGCESEQQVSQSTAEDSIKGLFEAIKAQDFEKASLYGTANTQISLRDFVTNLNMISEEEKLKVLSPFNFEISKVECSENQGSTVCKLCCSNDGDLSINMVKQDNKWFVQMEFAI
jgi:hypothetical protein